MLFKTLAKIVAMVKDLLPFFSKRVEEDPAEEKAAITGKYTVEDVWDMSYRGSYNKLIDDGKGTENSGVLGWNAHPYAVDGESKTVFFNTGSSDWGDTPSPHIIKKLQEDGWRIISSNRNLDEAERRRMIGKED